MEVTGEGGLDGAEVVRRQARFGPNDLDLTGRRGLVQALARVGSEPMFLLLLAAAAIYLFIGDRTEGLLLGFFAVVTVGLVIVQERRSDRALNALRALAVPHVRVIRDGRVQQIAARELVPGDRFLLGEGERVAADAILRAGEVSIDESLLTGESVPVRRNAAPGDAGPPAGPAAPGGDGGPFVFASTLVVRGAATAEVLAIGRDTRVGGIGRSLAGITPAPSPLQLHVRRLVQVLGAGAVALSALLALWYGLARGDWLQGLLSGIAAAMAILPEEFPMALSIFLALGAWRLARVRVLARRPAMIEALGGVTILCVDKTGTLTENRMRLRRVVTAGADVDLAQGAALPEELHALLEYANLASRHEGIEPMDRAIATQAEQSLAGTEHLHPVWQLEHEYPLTPALLAMSHAWSAPDGTRHVAAKGAPEAILDLCHLDAAAGRRWLDRVDALAGQGLRVLAVARGRAAGLPPADQHDYDFECLGLVAFEDPLRDAVPAAVAQALEAGIAVAMITGDHATTALAIAAQAGIDVRGGALTGEQMAAMDTAALARAVGEVRVFARVMPEQKLRLVEALRARGEIVAMTGDGVNDAPALKAAHIGIAMGARGTDVAREAAGIVLLDDDFTHIVAGVRMGRRIFDNLRRVMTYIVAVHVPVAGLAVLPVVLGMPPLMLPVHVVLTEMVIDPVCSLAFEAAPEAPGLMRRKPRPAADVLVGRALLLRGVLQGGLVLAATLGVYAWAVRTAAPEEARALAIAGLTVGNLGLVWLNASAGAGWRAVLGPGYRAFWTVGTLALGVVGAAMFVPDLAGLLRFARPSFPALLLACAAAAGSVLLAGGLQRILARRGRLSA